jgi:antagonist of KipI
MQRRSSRAQPRDSVEGTLKVSQRDPSSALGMTIVSAGFQTTVQDCGRIGLRKLGVTPGGALDSVSLRLANLLAGNLECAAGLEYVSGRLRLRFHDERLLAWSGGEFEVRVGNELVPVLHCARVATDADIEVLPQRGGRAWLAISGGISVPEILGSRATDLRAHFGGWKGRALRDGDELPLGVESELCARMRDEIPDHVSDWSAPRFVGLGKFLRIIRGKNWDDDIGAKLLVQKFRVAMDSDRMGLRLEGEEIAPDSRRELVSEAVTPGTIQLPPSGAPVVLLQGCQTIGGYPKIAHVITVDLGCAAQLQPLDEVRFELIELEQARELLRERERDIALFRVGLEARFG